MRNSASDSGSAALEYVLTLGVAVPFLVAWLTIFRPGEGYTDAGVQLTNYFQRMLTGISLPVP